MKKILIISCAAFLLIISSLGIAGWYFSGLVIKPKIKSYEETYRIELSKGRIIEETFKSLPFEVVFIQSPHGYKLHALYLASHNSKKTIIFAHGFSFSLLGSVKYMDIFRQLGFNILMYDHRHHGKSGGDDVTFGYFEADDLKAVVSWALEKLGGSGLVGVHGESIGAAIALQHAAIDNRVAFYISDGSFTSLPELLKYRLKSDFNLPPFPLYYVASFFSKLRAGFFFHEISPINSLQKATAPIFFIHGGADTYIPTEMGQRLFNTYSGKKAIYICPGAKHSESFWTNKKEYEKKIREFLKTVL
ncbi:MAG: alpha/beta hydrolase [Spirochaetes bacterium]|nr:alpha/beta hydrolase [Spirochaetota bacterium]